MLEGNIPVTRVRGFFSEHGDVGVLIRDWRARNGLRSFCSINVKRAWRWLLNPVAYALAINRQLLQSSDFQDADPVDSVGNDLLLSPPYAVLGKIVRVSVDVILLFFATHKV
jgi:hypothetical protein